MGEGRDRAGCEGAGSLRGGTGREGLERVGTGSGRGEGQGGVRE